MMAKFKRAEKRRIRLRMAVSGVSGSGKTYSCLAIAQGLGKRVAVIDTERGSASLYSGEFEFDVLELDHHSPGNYMSAIRDAANEGYDVLVIDSLSHSWTGEGGVLDVSRKKGGVMGNWKEASPLQEQLVGCILDFPGHVIVTMRAKTEYVISEKNGRVGSVEKVGLAPVQRSGIEYEFDIVGEIADQTLSITKSRIPSLQGRDFHRPGLDVAKTLLAWIEDGDERRFESASPATEEARIEPLPAIAAQPSPIEPIAKPSTKPKRPSKNDPAPLGPDSMTAANWRGIMREDVGQLARNAHRWQSMICAEQAAAGEAFSTWPDLDQTLARLAWKMRRDRYLEQIAEYDGIFGKGASSDSDRPSDSAAFDLGLAPEWRRDLEAIKNVRDKLKRRAASEGAKLDEEVF